MQDLPLFVTTNHQHGRYPSPRRAGSIDRAERADDVHQAVTHGRFSDELTS
jgi:hypothetical protein